MDVISLADWSRKKMEEERQLELEERKTAREIANEASYAEQMRQNVEKKKRQDAERLKKAQLLATQTKNSRRHV